MATRQFRRRRVRGVQRVAISVTLRPSLIRELDAYADELDWTRSGVVELTLERELSHVMDEALSMLGRKDEVINSAGNSSVREVE